MMHTQYEWLFIDMSVNNEIVEDYGFNQTVVIYTVSISGNRKENSFFSLYPSTLATWFQVSTDHVFPQQVMDVLNHAAVFGPVQL